MVSLNTLNTSANQCRCMHTFVAIYDHCELWTMKTSQLIFESKTRKKFSKGRFEISRSRGKKHVSRGWYITFTRTSVALTFDLEPQKSNQWICESKWPLVLNWKGFSWSVNKITHSQGKNEYLYAPTSNHCIPFFIKFEQPMATAVTGA